MSRAAVVDVCMDDDFNIFALGSLAGRPHVMSCSLFGQGGRSMTLKYLNEAVLILIRHFHFKRSFNCACSFVNQGKRRWMHRFMEHFEPASLTCISAGQSLVALGSKVGIK